MALVEIFISSYERGGDRLEEGDIGLARYPIGRAGRKALEGGWIALIIDTVLTPEELMASEFENDDPDDLIIRKRIYKIPLDSLLNDIVAPKVPGLDYRRLMNPDDAYQPFVIPDVSSNFTDKSRDNTGGEDIIAHKKTDEAWIAAREAKIAAIRDEVKAASGGKIQDRKSRNGNGGRSVEAPR